MSHIQAWLMATRPKTLTASIVPVLVGTSVAHSLGPIRLGPTLAALLGSVLLQIGSNLANDVYDFEKGADTADRVGPTRAVAAGLISPQAMKRAMWLVFLFASLAGIYLSYAVGPLVLAVGAGCIIVAFAYTGGPYPLGYHGLGDVFVMLFFGFVAVCGTVYVNLLSIPAIAWLTSIPIGALATAILVVNNVRDVETDTAAGKRTLVVRFGRGAGVAEYGLLLLAAYGTVPVLIFQLGFEAWVALPILTAPFGIKLFRAVQRQRGAALNATLARTAQLLALFGILLAVGIELGHPEAHLSRASQRERASELALQTRQALCSLSVRDGG